MFNSRNFLKASSIGIASYSTYLAANKLNNQYEKNKGNKDKLESVMEFDSLIYKEKTSECTGKSNCKKCKNNL